MPRAPCIDRTLTVTEAQILVLDIRTRKNKERTIYIAKTYQDDASLLRNLKKTWSDPNTLPVHVLSQRSFKRSFHMTENEYVTYLIKKEKELESK